MVPLGLPSARPMAQALRLPFEYYIYIYYIIIYKPINILVERQALWGEPEQARHEN